MYEFMSDIKKVDLGGGEHIYIYTVYIFTWPWVASAEPYQDPGSKFLELSPLAGFDLYDGSAHSAGHVARTLE